MKVWDGFILFAVNLSQEHISGYTSNNVWFFYIFYSGYCCYKWNECDYYCHENTLSEEWKHCNDYCNEKQHSYNSVAQWSLLYKCFLDNGHCYASLC